MEILPALQQLGFAEYEARAYLTLVKRSPLNGYELAKASGVPRPNIYGVLERLAARRAILRLEEGSGIRYAPVPPAELMRRLSGEYQQVADAASRALQSLEVESERDPVWNVLGYPALLDQARTLLQDAKRSLLLAVWPHEAAALQPEVAEADERGVEITTLCMAACEHTCGGCRGTVYRYQAASECATRRLVVMRDGKEVVAGEIQSDGEAQSIRTRRPLLIELCRSSVQASIALAAVVADLGERLAETLSSKTRAAIDAAAPAGKVDEFIKHMLEMR